MKVCKEVRPLYCCRFQIRCIVFCVVQTGIDHKFVGPWTS